jgi:hypothetical protein
MVKEKVLSGRYKDCPIVYDHIKSYEGEEIYFNSFSVIKMEPADRSRADYWSDSSLRVDGAMSSDSEKDQRYLSVKLRNGEESVLQVNTKTYNRLMEAVLGRVPQEHVETEKTVEKKSHKKAIFIAIVLIAIILKLFVFN